jgi:hypothetical protein
MGVASNRSTMEGVCGRVLVFFGTSFVSKVLVFLRKHVHLYGGVTLCARADAPRMRNGSELAS